MVFVESLLSEKETKVLSSFRQQRIFSGANFVSRFYRRQKRALERVRKIINH